VFGVVSFFSARWYRFSPAPKRARAKQHNTLHSSQNPVHRRELVTNCHDTSVVTRTCDKNECNRSKQHDTLGLSPNFVHRRKPVTYCHDTSFVRRTFGKMGGTIARSDTPRRVAHRTSFTAKCYSNLFTARSSQAQACSNSQTLCSYENETLC
jgi:hypothetical protein